MNNTLALAATQSRIQRLLITAVTGIALLLLAACGGSEAEQPVADQVEDSPTVSSTDTDTQDNIVASTDTTSDADSTTDGNTDVTEVLTPAERYVADANALLDAVTTTSDSVAAQLQNADVESSVWRTETATALRYLAAVLDSASALSAPADYATQHQALIDATSKYSWATEMLADGVETLDLTTINDAAALLANASAELATAQAGLSS